MKKILLFPFFLIKIPFGLLGSLLRIFLNIFLLVGPVTFCALYALDSTKYPLLDDNIFAFTFFSTFAGLFLLFLYEGPGASAFVPFKRNPTISIGNQEYSVEKSSDGSVRTIRSSIRVSGPAGEAVAGFRIV